MNNKTLCLRLAMSESENDVRKILTQAGFWENDDVWRYYGDQENNFATIGNQQRKPEAALVEKLINSVDAVLMAECLKRGINPASEQAPQSIKAAQEEYFNIYNGRLSNITPSRRTELADRIGLVATGQKSNPSYSVFDLGEGQTPQMMTETLLSLGKSNKLRIPFVQGKFNMGGTGVFQFCGDKNFQLIISKRHPEIVENYPGEDESSDLWGFTIIRREDPAEGIRNSVYKYLAPNRQILTFQSKHFSILPGAHPNAFGEPMYWGTYIKLYEYQMTGMLTNILFDLYNQLSLLMPSVALPIRLYERRDYSGHSLETTLSGLTVRVDEDKRDNLEDEFSPPPSSTISVKGQKMKVSFYVFKRDSAEKYRSSEGIVFVINGQTHGYLSKRFFSRQSVRLGYLADSLLLLVDCSDIEGRAREDLFMNSRDRLRSGDLASEIERRLEEMLREHPGLKALNSRRRKEDTENKLDDSKPLQEIIETILEKSPTLSKLFVKGLKLPDPFDLRPARKEEDYVGEKFPTHFKLVHHYPRSNPKQSPINRRLRVQYKTDASNDYFDRDMDTGEFNLKSGSEEIQDFAINLWNGIATLNIDLPESIKVGDLIHYTSFVSDNSRPDPFVEDFYIEVLPEIKKHPGKPGKRKPPSSKDEGDDVDELANLNLPNLIEVRKDNWDDHGFDRHSALKVIDSGEDGYDFYINMHNIHLLTEKKEKSEESTLLIDAKYKYSLVLIGLALIKDHNEKLEDESYAETNDHDIFEDIKRLSEVLSPIMIPMIDGLGALSEEELE